jgi:prolipoprotein diacylglyceryltransferase
MLVHPGFDPIALQIGPLAIRWYGTRSYEGATPPRSSPESELA